jgi:adenine-specific DNA-methyltransferase
MPTLDWLHKQQAIKTAGRVPYRLLNAESVHGQIDTGAADNWLIQGDNLEALKALLPFHAGRVKCIYIDPPYNTRSAFEHYDDNLEHSQWLSMMYPRLELLRELLAEDGSIWVSIDDNEAHYLKVVMAEVFGRRNFLTTIIWQQRTTRENRKTFSNNHEFILLVCEGSLALCCDTK